MDRTADDPGRVMTANPLSDSARTIAADRTVTARDIAAILLARWLVIASVLGLSLVLAIGYLVVTPRLYTGVASLLIDARTRPAVGDGGQSVNSYPDAILVESQVRVISSDLVLRRVVEAEHLDQDPEFAPPVGIGLRTRILTAIGLGNQAAPAADDPESRAVGTLAARVVVKRSERTYVADIEVTSRDPLKAARLANGVAKAYLADQQAARVEAAGRDSAWVLGQINEMQSGLREAELRVEAYKRDHGIIDANGKFLNEQELAEATTGVLLARAKAAEAKARFDQINRVIASGRTLDTLPDALKSPMIDRLRGQYADISRQQATLRETLGTRHPALLESDQQMKDVQRLIAEELKRIEVGVGNEYQTAQANATALERQAQGFRTSTVASNEDRVHLDELQRDVDARRTVYDRFLRARDTVKEQASDAPVGRIIAPAITPSAASSPKSFAVLLLASVFGVFVGSGLALLIPRLPPLRMPRRGVPPWTPSPGSGRPSPAEPAPVIGFVPAAFGEVRMAQGQSSLIERARAAWPTGGAAADRQPPDDAFMAALTTFGDELDTDPDLDDTAATLLVTSGAGRDGRSLIVMGLAEGAAREGRRVLVIDGNGTPSMLRDLVMPGARPDLIDLMGTTRMCYRVLAGWSGTVVIVPKLADQPRMIQRLLGRSDVRHIEGIRGHFDLVLFDGPATVEADRLRALAPLARHIVYAAVVGTAPTDVEKAIEALELPAGVEVAPILCADLASNGATSAAA